MRFSAASFGSGVATARAVGVGVHSAVRARKSMNTIEFWCARCRRVCGRWNCRGDRRAGLARGSGRDEGTLAGARATGCASRRGRAVLRLLWEGAWPDTPHVKGDSMLLWRAAGRTPVRSDWGSRGRDHGRPTSRARGALGRLPDRPPDRPRSTQQRVERSAEHPWSGENAHQT